jgi:hypothetical protein
MQSRKNIQNRRAFLKSSALGAGGLMLSFSWLSAQTSAELNGKTATASEIEFSGYVIVKEDNTVIIFSPNPEIGQNVKKLDGIERSWCHRSISAYGGSRKKMGYPNRGITY